MLGLLRPTMPTLGRSHLYFKDGSPRYPPQRRLENGNLAPRGPSYYQIERTKRIKDFMSLGHITKHQAGRLVDNHCRTWQDALAKANDPNCKKVSLGKKGRSMLDGLAREDEYWAQVGECQKTCDGSADCGCFFVGLETGRVGKRDGFGWY